jgi:hypothetical protein
MVSSKVSINNSGSSHPAASKWDDAIKDAEGELRILERKLVRLQQAIRIFRVNKKDGVPWPRPSK